MKLLYISPTGKGTFKRDMINLLHKHKNKETEVTYISLKNEFPDNLEYRSFEALVLSELINIVYRESDNYDCIIVGGFFDPGIKELREISGSTPVIGPFSVSISVASTLGNSISILVGKNKWINRIKEEILIYGYNNLISSIRSINFRVHELQSNKEVIEKMILTGNKCVDEDLAEVIILGCTVKYGFADKISNKLNIPVIEPIPVTLKYAEMIAYLSKECGYKPSRLHSSSPPEINEIKKYITENKHYANKKTFK